MRGEAVSTTVPPEVNLRTFEVVVIGDVGPTVWQEFAGLHVARAEGGRTHLVGQVDDPFRLYDLLESLGNANVRIVSLKSMEDGTGQ
jgi:hypothetical protein